ncbi:hypothetical protein [Geobacter sp. AOG2]|uniref:hypothetical protein n=1 Tax=Geobacter sp. AOG2 TaxID=1566347 RepID=UPI001CC6D36E|nr:hypothetical protein [Geobacter sp. AOG2]GFE62446.1 hypothetical protein AOG2_30340 [Geobacter sp. AOG2]
MKCPKCGYNSFEYNDNCPKCLNDLTGYKATYGLKAMALPLAARMDMAQSMAVDAPPADSHSGEDADAASDIFSFDFGDDELESPQGGDDPARDPFDFDVEPAGPADVFPFGEERKTAQEQAEEEAFSSLLETTPQKSAAAPAAKPAAANNEFDLENFSWDDTPDPAGDGTPAKPREDDFDSLFGGGKK